MIVLDNVLALSSLLLACLGLFHDLLKYYSIVRCIPVAGLNSDQLLVPINRVNNYYFNPELMDFYKI